MTGIDHGQGLEGRGVLDGHRAGVRQGDGFQFGVVVEDDRTAVGVAHISQIAGSQVLAFLDGDRSRAVGEVVEVKRIAAHEFVAVADGHVGEILQRSMVEQVQIVDGDGIAAVSLQAAERLEVRYVGEVRQVDVGGDLVVGALAGVRNRQQEFLDQFQFLLREALTVVGEVGGIGIEAFVRMLPVVEERIDLVGQGSVQGRGGLQRRRGTDSGDLVYGSGEQEIRTGLGRREDCVQERGHLQRRRGTDPGDLVRGRHEQAGR